MKSNYNYFSRRAQFLKLFFIAVMAFVLGTQNSYASHAAGGNLTYCHGVGNNYTLNFTLYRDCFGIPAPTSITVNISSVSCGLSFSAILNPIPGTGQEITHPCAGTFSTCQGGAEPGIQKWEYETNYAFPAQCNDWTISTAVSARNAAITTIVNPGGLDLFIDAHLDNSSVDNCSPQFSVDPIVFVCIGQPFVFNNGALDADGDSLVYSFITPRSAANTDVVYNAGYSVTNPVSSNPAVSIDPVNGDITFNATAQEVGVMAVLIQEYRNGVLIGTVMRDIQIYTVPCINSLPTLSGINGTTNFAMTACAGTNICFDIFSADSDAVQILTVQWNNGIPAATFTFDNSNRPTSHFCWATQPSDARPQPYTFTITVRDNNCPSTGAQVYSYSILLTSLSATATSTPVSCNGSFNGTVSATVIGGVNPLQYLWSPGQHVGQTVTGLGAGTYSVYVLDSNGCQATQTVVVTQPPAMQTTISALVDASCGTPGSFDITTIGGTAGYTYYTNTVPPSTGTHVVAQGGGYTVTVRDANNCRTLTPVTVGSSGSLSAIESHTDVTCNGALDGTATLTLTGATGNEVFVWTPNVSIGTSASGLAGGSYVVDISNGACSTQVVINIAEPTAIVATETHTNVGCNGALDGSITLNVTGGSGTYNYVWTPNVSTGASATSLAGGTYCVDITDDNQCTANICVTLTEADPIVLTTSSAPASCLLTNGSATVVASGGSGSYSYSWSNGGTTATISNIGTGTYTVDVMDAGGCIATATVNVSSTGVNATETHTDATCENGDDGSATITATGGQAPYTYGWSPVGDSSATVNGLAPGTYVVTVTDYLGCSVIVNVVIGFVNPAPSLELGADSAACIGTTVTLDAGAGMTSYLWSDNSTNQTLDVTAAGAYGVVVTDANGCQNSDLINVSFVQCANALIRHSSGAEFSVYPNPAHNMLNISISNVKNENVKVELSDILGNKVYTATEKSTIGYKSNINISSIPSGVYLLKVQYLNEVKTIKVVKN
ncbi:MAG: T9SS type A sorting domain-containing protein [Bacteroidota bacterium]